MRFLALLAALPLVASAADAPPPAAKPVPAGDYAIDQSHTSLIFRVNHLGFSTYTGRFTKVDAQLRFDPRNLANSRLKVSIDPRSIEADNAPSGFMATLAGKDWLDADRFPTMTFVSKAVEPTGANAFRIRGELTMHGVTRPVNLSARYNGGYAGHPQDPNARIGFSARGEIKRSDFGVSFGIPEPGTTMGVGDLVEVIIETELSGPPL